MPYCGRIYRLVTLVPEASTGPTAEEKVVLPEVDRQFDKAVGRNVYVRFQGVRSRVFRRSRPMTRGLLSGPLCSRTGVLAGNVQRQMMTFFSQMFLETPGNNRYPTSSGTRREQGTVDTAQCLAGAAGKCLTDSVRRSAAQTFGEEGTCIIRKYWRFSEWLARES